LYELDSDEAVRLFAAVAVAPAAGVIREESSTGFLEFRGLSGSRLIS